MSNKQWSSLETYDAFINRRWMIDKDNGPWSEHCCYDKYHEFNPFYLTNLDFDLFVNDEIKQYVNEFIMQCDNNTKCNT
jgi:hypothetical protein